MYCQNATPSVALSESYDGDQLFSFDFSQNIRVPRLPEFADWAQKSGDTSNILFDKGFCQTMIQKIGPHLEGKIPVSRGQGFLGGWSWACILNLINLQIELFPSHSSLPLVPPGLPLGPLVFYQPWGALFLLWGRTQVPRM